MGENSSTPNSPDNSNNNSCIALRAIFGVIAFLAIAGNWLVIVVLLRNRRLRKHASAVVIVSLAITDMVTGIVLVITPAFIIGDSNMPIPSGLAGEVFCRLVSSQYFVFTFGKVSIATVMCLAIERWFAVAKPIKYKFNFTRRRMIFYLVLIWVACCALNSRALFEKRLVTTDGTLSCKWVPLTQNKLAIQVYVILHSIITFFVPLIVTMAAFVHLYTIIRKQRINGNLATGSRPSGLVVQLVWMCFVTAVVLGVCWLPNQVFFILSKFDVTRPDTTLHHVTVVLSMLNSCANPWVYCATSRTYRRGFARLFCGCFVNSVGMDDTEMTIPAGNRIAKSRVDPGVAEEEDGDMQRDETVSSTERTERADRTLTGAEKDS